VANNTTDLYTTVLNPSSSSANFPYLGAHGKNLPGNAQFTVWGDIQQSLGNTLGASIALRKQKALEKDLLSGRIVIVQTPKTILLDPASDPIVPNPTVAATVAVTGGGSTGGTLAAGHYSVAYTWVTDSGESTIGASTSADFTVTLGNIPQVTLPVLPSDVNAINLYITAMNASASDVTTFRLYVTNIVSTTVNLPTLVPALGAANPAPPTVNSTAGHSVQALILNDEILGIADPSWGSIAL
jgi:hypothetical protein